MFCVWVAAKKPGVIGTYFQYKYLSLSPFVIGTYSAYIETERSSGLQSW